MDFSNLLSKEIDRKRKQSKSKAQKRQKTCPELEPEPKPEIQQPEPHHDEESQLLEAISAEKLQKSLGPEHESGLSKTEQLRKLEILVKNERKNELYQKHLEAESVVDPTVQLKDIGNISDAESYKRLSLQVRKFVKQILRNWEAAPETVPGQYTVALLNETKRDVVKLLYKLRSQKLKPDMLVSLSTIAYYIQTSSFAKANESYMKLSIGNVAWPIGIRDVGIHARSALLKITGDDKSLLANIMQNEHTRKWIIAVKRLITYCEREAQKATPR